MHVALLLGKTCFISVGTEMGQINCVLLFDLLALPAETLNVSVAELLVFSARSNKRADPSHFSPPVIFC